MKKMFLAIVVVFMVSAAMSVSAQTTEFTYQGSLKNTGAPATGNHDFEFALFDAASGGAQIGTTLTRAAVAVTSGTFAVQLDFGAQFPGANRYLEIRVRQTGGGAYTTLTPRQLVNSAPYAVKSLNAESLGGVPANQYVTTTTGGSNFIQNTTTQQASSNFNVSGNGVVGGNLDVGAPIRLFNASGNQWSIQNRSGDNSFEITELGGGGSRMVIQDGTGAVGIGEPNPSYKLDVLHSGSSGLRVRSTASFSVVDIDANSGDAALRFIRAGVNQWNIRNSPTTDDLQIFELGGGGERMRIENNTGRVVISGDAIVAGNFAVNGTFALPAGSSSYIQNTPAAQQAGNFNISGNGLVGGNMGIGTATPASKLHVIDASNTGLRVQTNVAGGTVASFGGFGAFQVDAQGTPGGRMTIQENGNVGIGTNFPQFRLDVADRIRIKQKTGSTGVNDTAGIWFSQNTPTNPERAFVGMENDNSVGFYSPSVGSWGLVMNTTNLVVKVNALGAAGSTALCRNASNEISTCSSSLKYKKNIGKFSQGMAFVRQLRPISFDWKDGGMKDVGFGAEDIAKIDPRFVTYNTKGEVEGVKYDRLSVAFVNAFKEQQSQIEVQAKEIAEQKTANQKLQTQVEQQQSQLKNQQAQIDALKELVCSQSPTAAACKK